MKILVTAMVLSALFGCSNGKKIENAPEQTVMDLEKGLDETDFIVDAKEGDLILEGEKIDSINSGVNEMVASSLEEATEGLRPEINGIGDYTVKEGDTLMLIAFNIYGDYRKWHKIADLNQGIANRSLKKGEIVKYSIPNQKFIWNPQGLSYLIKRGDSLGVISTNKYGTSKRWRDLWENNKPLIVDPNLIFAGFTIYYIPDRDVASE